MAHKVKETQRGYYDIIVDDSGSNLSTDRRKMRETLEQWVFHKREWKADNGTVLEERDSEIIIVRFRGLCIEFMVFRPAHKVKGGGKWGCLMHVKGNCMVRKFGRTRREALLAAWGSD
jgi:hypothetical protein